MLAWKQFPQMFAAHLKITFREKAVWFWNIFFPVILMVLFTIIFGGNAGEFKARVAVADPRPGETSAQLMDQLRRIPGLDIHGEGTVSTEEGRQLVLDKKVFAYIELPSEEDPAVRLVVHRENERNITSQALAGVLEQFVQQANYAALGAAPVFRLDFETVTTGRDELKFQDFLMTGMIALSLAQSGLFGMVGLVEMRRKGVLRRLRLTPASTGMFGIADMAVRFVLGVLQIALLTTVGVLGFGAKLHLHLASLAVAFFVGVLAFNAIGYLFSAVSKSQEAYMAMANIASFLMMFISGVFFPVDSLPEWLQPLSRVLPLSYFVDGIRDGMVYARGIADASFWIAVAVLAAWGILAFLVGARLYKAKSIAEAR
mgnify:FL=1